MTSNHPENPKIIVIGGGITGLTAAHCLSRKGCVVRLLEKEEKVGGSIGSESAEGWLVEAGPNTLLEEEKSLRELSRSLGIEPDIMEAKATAKNRYIVRGGKPRPVPTCPVSLLSSGLFSPTLPLRVLAETFKRPLQRPADVSLAQMVGEHLGKEIVDYALDPFVSGIYAGDPNKLSARHSFPQLWEIEKTHGSLLRGMIAAAKKRKAAGGARPRIFSFRTGLQELPDALARSLPSGSVVLGATATKLRKGERWTVEWKKDGASYSESADAVVIALPAGVLAPLPLENEKGEHRPFEKLAELPHPAVSSLFLGFRREQVKHPLDGFGMLVPSLEKKQILGVLFSSSLFDGRAPEGHVALTIMAGGMRNPQVAALGPTELEAKVLPEVRELLGVSGEPVFRRCHRWKAAIPQYNLGHEQFTEVFERAEKDNPGLLLGGNARDGISVTNCLKAGRKLAERVMAGTQ